MEDMPTRSFRAAYWAPILPVVAVSIVLYIRILMIIIRLRNTQQFSSFFFRMCISHGFYDITFAIWYIFVQMSVTDKIFGDNFLLSMNIQPLPMLFYYYIYYFLHGQVIGILVLSINRLCVVSFPHSSFTKLFDKIPLYAMSLFHVLIPIPFIIHMLFFQAPVYFYVGRNGSVVRYTALESVNANSLQAAIVTLTASVLSAGCYIAVIIQLVRNRGITSSPNTAASRNRDLALTLVCFSLFVTLALEAAFYCSIFIATVEGDNDAVVQIRPFAVYTSMLLSFINPWMLTLTNKSTRKRLLPCSKVEDSSVGRVMTVTNNSGTIR